MQTSREKLLSIFYDRNFCFSLSVCLETLLCIKQPSSISWRAFSHNFHWKCAYGIFMFSTMCKFSAMILMNTWKNAPLNRLEVISEQSYAQEDILVRIRQFPCWWRQRRRRRKREKSFWNYVSFLRHVFPFDSHPFDKIPCKFRGMEG